MHAEHPRWWLLLRDTLLLVVGLGGIVYEHSTVRDARPLLITADLILVGMIPLNHVVARWRSPISVEKKPNGGHS